VDVEGWEEQVRAARRKQRRQAIGLVIVGALFAAAGVLLWVVGNPWMGPIGLAFGGMAILTGIVTATGSESPGARIATIVACFLFALTGALALVAGIVAPAVWGWRGGGAGIIAGSLTLAFFGPGTIILIIREVRRRNGPRSAR